MLNSTELFILFCDQQGSNCVWSEVKDEVHKAVLTRKRVQVLQEPLMPTFVI